MTVVVEPTASVEKLRSLLAEQCESTHLDFKESCDLSDNKARIELVKDIAAMQVHGGYIVIGADDHGQPVTWPATEHTAHRAFDETNLRQQAERYLEPPITLLSQVHTVGDHVYVLVFVAPHPDPFTPFKEDGSYVDAKNRNQAVFRKGQVYVRRGTSSAPIRQSDVPEILRRHDDAVREQARDEFAKTIAAIERNRVATTIAEGPIEGFTWLLDEQTYTTTALELMRRNDTIALQHGIFSATSALGDAVQTDDGDTGRTVLDRIVTVCALAITYEDDDIFNRAVDAFASAYSQGFEQGFTRTRPGLRPELLWLEVISRVEALGALAVRRHRWDLVRVLADQPPHGSIPGQYRSWMRHGSVNAAVAGLFGRSNDANGNLISIARTHVDRVPALRPDLAAGSDDALLNSLCVYDAAWCLVAQANSGRPGRTNDFFTDFAYYEERRTLPFFDQVVEDPALRQRLLPDVDDQTLAETLVGVLSMASKQSPWSHFDRSPVVDAFVVAST